MAAEHTTIKLADIAGFDAKKPLHAYLILSPILRDARDCTQFLCETLLCEEPLADGSPCGRCRACIKVLAGTHPDISILGRGEVKVADVRNMRDSVYLSPHESDRRVLVLESVDKFNDACLNALLKILEEPPEGRFFLLTASVKSAVLPTILSRVCVLAPARKALYADLSTQFPDASPEQRACMQLYLETYEDTDINALEPEKLEKAFELAYGFFTGEQPLFVPQLSKKREELAVVFRVFMLISGDICAYKSSMGRLRKERIESAAYGSLREKFRKVCARLSVKRALGYYDLFEKAYLMTEDYANSNALKAYLTQNL